MGRQQLDVVAASASTTVPERHRQTTGQDQAPPKSVGQGRVERSAHEGDERNPFDLRPFGRLLSSILRRKLLLRRRADRRNNPTDFRHRPRFVEAALHQRFDLIWAAERPNDAMKAFHSGAISASAGRLAMLMRRCVLTMASLSKVEMDLAHSGCGFFVRQIQLISPFGRAPAATLPSSSALSCGDGLSPSAFADCDISCDLLVETPLGDFNHDLALARRERPEPFSQRMQRRFVFTMCTVACKTDLNCVKY